MTKLHQVVAVRKGIIDASNKATAPLFHALGRGELFNGLTQRYEPLDEDGEMLPNDDSQVQLTVEELTQRFTESVTRVMDVISTHESGNQSAKADVVFDGEVVMEDVPVVVLIQLEGLLNKEVRGFIRGLPTLDPADEWAPSTAGRSGMYETPEFKTHRTRKMEEPIVLYHATDKHPAQTQMVVRDKIVGYWNKKKFSGAITQARKADLLDRVERLVEAFKDARARANDVTVEERPVGRDLLDRLFA